MTMQVTSAAADSTSSPATRRSTASSTSVPCMIVVRGIRRARAGATQTLVIASATPQPKKVRPIPIAPNPSGKGEKASRMKNPML